ncbi:MAG: DNA-3-methyladenine glycosylase [Candidatus Caenarcaniphilales bacterium]|nr:DNA-3-methyladenine glycosylase [Candidatus Caenarcaniphilales bacterium]
MGKITKDFYLRDNVVFIAQELIGQYVLSNINGVTTGGMIVETEAYKGPEDRASHAYQNKRSKRTEIMFAEGGVAYIYLCYGIHSLFNIVTNMQGIPHAVLIRAIEPTIGVEEMMERRKQNKLSYNLSRGPGTVSQALGVNTSHSGTNLSENLLWLEYGQKNISINDLLASPRVGIDYAGEDAKLPWRFRLKGNKWIGK